MTVADWVHIFCASKWLQIKVIEKTYEMLRFYKLKKQHCLSGTTGPCLQWNHTLQVPH